VIVVIGFPIGRITDSSVLAAGMCSRVALAAVRAGGIVQLVGKTGDDPTADAVVLDLARGGIGHAALLREPARVTPLESAPAEDIRPEPDLLPVPVTPPADAPDMDAADVDLGLRYLTDFGVVIVAEPVRPDVVAIVSEAARWAEARMVLVVAAGSSAPDGLPADVIVFEAPAADPDGVFADLVGSFAAALDDGVEPEEAFRVSIGSDGWTGVADD